MAYKALNDRVRQDALLAFLNAASTIRGICVSVIMNKSLERYLLKPGIVSFLQENGQFESKWNAREFETMARITCLVSMFVAGLAQPKQNVFWVSDEDNIHANSTRSTDTVRLLSGFSSHFVTYRDIGTWGTWTTQRDPSDKDGVEFDEDTNSIPDLVGGALVDLISVISEKPGWMYGDQFDYSTVKPKSYFISSWLLKASKALKDVTIVFDDDSNGNLAVFPLVLD